jgi:EmrB/QacA subfamily drug resistance transporter
MSQNLDTNPPVGKTFTTVTGVTISHRQLYMIMVGVMLGILLSALDSTVVGPAMFKIIKDLKGLEHYAWVTTAYLLTSTITVPIFGKLGDLYGRKWLFVGGMVVFMIGSALSGLSSGTEAFNLFGLSVSGLTTGMAQLIFFRALQGVGAGIMTANAFTIIGDLVAPAERGRWQGLFGAVFGLASVIGPTIGGYITDNIGWQWVFYVNIPVGVLAVAVVSLTFPHLAPARKGSRSVDWLGAGLLVAGTTPILLGLSLGGGKDFPWGSAQTISIFAVGLVFIALFIFAESRVKEPLIPLDLFKNRTFSLSILSVLLVGVGMFGALINIPLYIQGVQGDTATNSGNAITPMMFGMIVVSIISGQILSRTGKYRALGIIGTSLFTIGLFLLSTMTIDTPRLQTIAYMVLLGAGLGIAMPLYTLVVQNAFPIERLGVVTSATTFFRSIGGTVGVAVLGTIVNNRFSTEYASRLPALIKDNPQLAGLVNNLGPQALISPETIATIQRQLASLGMSAQQITAFVNALLAPIKPALDMATTEAFRIGAFIVALAIVATALIPEIPLRKAVPRTAPGREGAAETAGRELAEELANLSPREAAEVAGR